MHIVEFIGRLLLSTLFLIEGFGKITMQEDVIMYMEDYNVPGILFAPATRWGYFPSFSFGWIISDEPFFSSQKNINLKNIIKSMMPGGSVIGCPKIRTLQLLNSQEKEGRNIFTGSFGFIKFNMDMRFNIIIRSILNFKNVSEISAASGVVLDSSSKKEFSENYIKAKSLLELFK